MNRFILSFAVIAVCSVATISNAAVLNFQGVINSQVGPAGFLGAVPPAVNFAINLTVADGAGPMGAITGGTFNFIGNSIQPITGSTVTLTEGGANDTVSFVVTTASGTGLFSFTGDNFITGTAVNQANLDGLAANGASTGFSFITGGGTIYQGNITAVPEPASCLALLGVVGAGAWRMRRSRKVPA